MDDDGQFDSEDDDGNHSFEENYEATLPPLEILEVAKPKRSIDTATYEVGKYIDRVVPCKWLKPLKMVD